ncbi:FAD-dependent oxidoreductase [Clostridium folliculivorans]|uniref:FAD-dependent oxidoreductase n=1 Tax=Clostridium folliculivorans TaxID=2886038 RepID=A0A9W5Y415_9CLOT|nr:FAD-dependent oxidoreductase [Clostridium folliculivorans]GKU26164.1 FAD-dependent oxidoreductase [Clostridium folliculivorans]GKU28250.1 FAD-dependent oxidoreductase [Clostridium folliculivorans]
MKLVIVGGGWAGCAAAIAAKKAGAEVEIFERTDLLLGVGNVGGIMRNNGRYTAAEELIALGAGELIDIMDRNAIHKNVDFPQHKHAWLCDVSKVEPEVRKYILDLGIKVNFRSRAINVVKENNEIKAIKFFDKTVAEADAFVEATGSTGSMENCNKYGNGCVMCILRCPTFGMRVSLSAKAGIVDIPGERGDGTIGAFSGSCEIPRESVSPEILKELEEKGSAILKVPEEDINMDKLDSKVCQQYALKEFAENIVLLDTGHIKVMTSYYPLEKLRKIKGLENARYIDPYSGGVGNSIRYLSSTPRDNDMKVKGIDNLFVAGEKAGFFIGHTEAMSTGTLAGYNAVRNYLGMETLILPRKTVVGDIIAYANERLNTEDGRRVRHTFSGAEYFERMKALGLYTTDNDEIKNKIKDLGISNIFNQRL